MVTIVVVLLTAMLYGCSNNNKIKLIEETEEYYILEFELPKTLYYHSYATYSLRNVLGNLEERVVGGVTKESYVSGHNIYKGDIIKFMVEKEDVTGEPITKVVVQLTYLDGTEEELVYNF